MDLWIEELERLHHINHLILREPLPYIHVFYIFINEQNEIVDSIKQLWKFQKYLIESESNIVLPKEKILTYLEQVQRNNYFFHELVRFHIPLEPEMLSSLKTSQSFLQSFDHFDNISLPPSLFIFHPFNTLYFIFKEKEKEKKTVLKSALSNGTKSHTKKAVKFKNIRHTRHSTSDL